MRHFQGIVLRKIQHTVKFQICISVPSTILAKSSTLHVCAFQNTILTSILVNSFALYIYNLTHFCSYNILQNKSLLQYIYCIFYIYFLHKILYILLFVFSFCLKCRKLLDFSKVMGNINITFQLRCFPTYCNVRELRKQRILDFNNAKQTFDLTQFTTTDFSNTFTTDFITFL